MLTTAPCRIDVILLDYELPGSHDRSLLSVLKRVAPSTPVVAMSAFWTADTMREARAAGADRIVGKPLDMREVAALLQGTVLHATVLHAAAHAAGAAPQLRTC
jgi:DNA-binding NarL/FixJ family response regulator